MEVECTFVRDVLQASCCLFKLLAAALLSVFACVHALVP